MAPDVVGMSLWIQRCNDAGIRWRLTLSVETYGSGATPKDATSWSNHPSANTAHPNAGTGTTTNW